MGFYICAIFTVKEGKSDEVHSHLDKIFELVQTKEPETLQYQITTNSEKPNEIVIFEEYANEAAFNSHCSSDLFRTFAKAAPDLLEGGIDIKKVQLKNGHVASRL